MDDTMLLREVSKSLSKRLSLKFIQNSVKRKNIVGVRHNRATAIWTCYGVQEFRQEDAEFESLSDLLSANILRTLVRQAEHWMEFSNPLFQQAISQNRNSIISWKFTLTTIRIEDSSLRNCWLNLETLGALVSRIMPRTQKYSRFEQLHCSYNL